MAVKTNQEYHAVQHEIAFAQTEIKKIEDAILERMMESRRADRGAEDRGSGARRRDRRRSTPTARR